MEDIICLLLGLVNGKPLKQNTEYRNTYLDFRNSHATNKLGKLNVRVHFLFCDDNKNHFVIHFSLLVLMCEIHFIFKTV